MRWYLSMANLPLGILRMSDYVSQTLFRAILNGMESIGVSLSSGCTRVSCAGVMLV